MASMSERETREIEQANASGRHAGRLRPRPLAAAEQLGPAGADLFEQARLRNARAGLARRSGNASTRRARTRTSSPARRCRQSPTTTADVIGKLDEEARRDRALDRRTVRPDARRPWALGSHGCHRPGRVSRRPAAAPVRAQGGWTLSWSNPAYRGRAITLTFDQFKYGWTNALDEDEAKQPLRRPTTWPGPGIALAQMADANLNPWTESKVDTKNPGSGPAADPRRGEGPHGSLGDRQRRLQAAEAQPGRHRDQGDAQTAATR